MTVCTSHLAFRQFPLEPLSARIASNENADLAILRAGHVVELQNHNVAFAAINTRVRLKIPPDVLALPLPLSFRPIIPTLVMLIAVAPIVRLAICPLAFSTIRTRAEFFDVLRRNADHGFVMPQFGQRFV